MSDSFFKIRNKKTAVFLICLGISAFFWLLIKLSAEYEISVDIPIVYSDFPKGQTLINQPDSNVSVRIRDNGFDLLGASLFGNHEKLNLSISSMKSNKQNSFKSKSYILTKELFPSIKESFNAAKQISIIEPDSLVLYFEKQAFKKVRVFANITTKLSPQYQLKQKIVVSPDSVMIYGSFEDLKHIDSLFTEERVFNDISAPISAELKLILPKHIEGDHQWTQLNIDVEKFTEAIIKVPIDISFAQEQNIRIFPNHVQIKYAVSFEKFNDISPDSFLVIAKEDPSEIGKLEFLLQEHPEGIRIIDYSPKMGEFIILK